MRVYIPEKKKDYSVSQTFHAVNTPLARREWTCALCGKKIALNTRYARYTWRQKYHIDDLKYHYACWQLVKFYCKRTDTNLYTAEDVIKWLKTRRICRSCTSDKCDIESCPNMRKYIGFKPYMTRYDRLKPMDDKTIPPEYGFEFVDDENL